jgi:NADH-quinone oxidoreductase subunit C|tara:strand:+ start:2189 stop:2890 length:702 start_codon:yes stop_codon:yes gene_type:complete
MTDNLEKLIKEAVEKALEGDMDAINNIEDRVTRSKAKAALVKAKREVAKVETEASPDEDSNDSFDSKEDKTTNEHIAELLIQQFSDDINKELSSQDHIQIQSKNWLVISTYLRDDPACLFDSLQCITGVDLGEESDLEVRYNLHSMTHRHAVEIRISCPRNKAKVPSVESIWRIGDWFERETYDMYGIEFEGHRDLTRILLPEDWEGWPLRKDYEVQETYHGIVVPKVKDGWE